jgi:ATP-dependent 26S proteasome regulatory subunit
MLDLDLLIRARYPLLYIVTPEEEPVLQQLAQVAHHLIPQRQLLVWDLVRGWQDNSTHRNSIMGALGRVRTEEVEPTIFVLKDLHFILQYPHNPSNAPVIRELKNLAADLKYTHHTLILTSHTLIVPPELAEEVTVIDCPLPDEGAIAQLLTEAVTPDQLRLNTLAKEQFVNACQGLSRTRIQRVLARALAAKGEVNAADIESALEEKKQAIRQTGLLEFYAAQASLKSVGGLENLKQWVRLRKDAFTEEARRYGIPNPKGVLLVGIQGTGKSLSAKTIAHEWRLPLLRLDTGRLFGGLVGESESRVRRMIQITEAIAPCVLWIDEIDKAFGNISGSVDGDSGTSRRMFGALITWMQEKTAPVFIVATANNVRILPAELLRKGRFDEIFFLNLPTEKERQEIFNVHLQRLRPSRLREFNRSLLAKQTKDFSGAEIEQVIFDAMHQAFAEGQDGQRRDFVDTDILRAVEDTVPLAAIARDQIEDLKRWSAEVGARTASQDTELTQALRDYMKRRGFNAGDSDLSR